MATVTSVLQEILGTLRYTPDSLATELGVSASTVNRWINGKARPRPVVEGQLRHIHASLTAKPSYIREPLLPLSLTSNESPVKAAIDGVLRELREILHRRGRLSSRNEALDELCKLLFAHAISLSTGSGGITKKNVLQQAKGSEGIAAALKRSVDRIFTMYLPASLSHEMIPADFELKIKPQEDALAAEIIECFEILAAQEKFKDQHGMREIDILNEAFGQFLADSFVDEKQLGQYLTPPEVVRFMVKLAIRDMSESDRARLCNPDKCYDFGLILDPSCGVGSFLTETLRSLHPQVLNKYGPAGAEGWLRSMVTDVIVGIDKSERMIRLALTNMALFGVPSTKLHLANALDRTGSDSDRTRSFDGKVGLILTNPPFGAEFKGNDLRGYKVATRWPRRAPETVDSELLFIERYVDWLRPDGQFLAIVPDSILTNKGLYEDLRRNLSDKIDIRSVISLPSETFGAAGTSTKTSVLQARKRPSVSARKGMTYFAICHDIGYSVSTRDTHRTKIRNGTGDLPKILEEIDSGDEKLTYGRRVAQVEQSPRWDATYHASLSSQIIQRLGAPSRYDVRVSDVAVLSTEKTDPRRWGSDCFRYIEISDVDPQSCMVQPKMVPCSEAPGRARMLVRSSDVLFSTVRPERRTVGVVRDDQDGSVCTTGFAVLRPKSIDPLVLAFLLKTDFVAAQVMRNNIGIAYPAIEEACLLDILLPIRRQDLATFTSEAESLLALERKRQVLREAFVHNLGGAVQRWLHEDAKEDSKPRQTNQTKSHLRLHKRGSDVHGQGTLKLEGDRKA